MMVVWIGSVGGVTGVDIGVFWMLGSRGVLSGCVGRGVVVMDMGYDVVGLVWVRTVVGGVFDLSSLS